MNHEKILLVDDEPDILETLAEILESLEVEFVLASNGKQALDLVHNDPNIRVVISDIKMPNFTGINFLTQLREEKNFIPVIFMTGFGDMQLMRQAWNLGAFDFVDKPINEKYLVQTTLAALLYGRSKEVQVAETQKEEQISVLLDKVIYERFKVNCDNEGKSPLTVLNSLIVHYLAGHSGVKK